MTGGQRGEREAKRGESQLEGRGKKGDNGEGEIMWWRDKEKEIKRIQTKEEGN